MLSDPRRTNLQSAAEKAVSVIGFGYDLSSDIRFSYCKPGPSGSRLIELDETLARDLVFPGGATVPNVPKSIRCDKGERTRFHSDVLSFHQVFDSFRPFFFLENSSSGFFHPPFRVIIKRFWNISFRIEEWFLLLSDFGIWEIWERGVMKGILILKWTSGSVLSQWSW